MVPSAPSHPINRAAVNRIFVVLIVLSNTFGNYLLAIGMERLPDFFAVPLGSYILKFATNWHVLAGMMLLALWMTAQLTIFTWADISYVLPVTASSYIVTALLGKFALHEEISAGRWVGIVVIAIGSMLAAMTPRQTVEHPEHGELSE